MAECKPYKKSHICRMDDFLEDAEEIVYEQANQTIQESGGREK